MRVGTLLVAVCLTNSFRSQREGLAHRAAAGRTCNSEGRTQQLPNGQGESGRHGCGRLAAKLGELLPGPSRIGS